MTVLCVMVFIPWGWENSACHIGWWRTPMHFPQGTQTACIHIHMSYDNHMTEWDSDLLNVSWVMRNRSPEMLVDWKLFVILVASILASGSEVLRSGCFWMILRTWRSNPSARYEGARSPHNTPVNVARMTMCPMAGVCWGGDRCVCVGGGVERERS